MQLQRRFFGDNRCIMENSDFEDPLYDIARRKKVNKSKSQLFFRNNKMAKKFGLNRKGNL